MPKVLRETPLVVVFWLAAIIATVLVWKIMPTVFSQAALVTLVILVIASTFLKQTELPILTTIFLGLLLINFYLTKYPDNLAYFVMATAVIVPVLGLSGDRINRGFRQLDQSQELSHWLILGLISGEAVSLFANWPVSFFNRTLLSAIFFYTFWQTFRIRHNEGSRNYIGHFVFVSLTVIVVVGIILWLNFLHPTT